METSVQFCINLPEFRKNIFLLKNYEKLHSTVILLKPNEARLTPSLEYCITELLNFFPKGFASNIGKFEKTEERNMSVTSGFSHIKDNIISFFTIIFAHNEVLDL